MINFAVDIRVTIRMILIDYMHVTSSLQWPEEPDERDARPPPMQIKQYTRQQKLKLE